MIEACLKGWLLVGLLLFLTPSLPLRLRFLSILAALSCGCRRGRWSLRSFLELAIYLCHFLFIVTSHECLDLLFGLGFAQRRLQITVHLVLFLVELRYGFGALPSIFRVIGLVRGRSCPPTTTFVLSFFIVVEGHHLKINRLFSALFSRRRRHDPIDVVSEVMHCKCIVSAILILPSEGILFLFLLPEYLEHSAVVDEVEAIVNSLERDALPMDRHLVDERFCLLLHLSFELAINHDFFLTAHF